MQRKYIHNYESIALHTIRGDPAKTPTPKEFPKLLQAMTI